MSASPSSSALPVRSSRTRIKSQRALDSEFTDRLFRPKDKPEATPSEPTKPPDPSKSQSKAKAKAKGKGHGKGPTEKGKKGKKDEVYCVCRTDGSDGRAMIECGVCGDWFHFDCVHLNEHEAERIHKYVCPGCEERTGEKTTQTYDITTFASPSPPTGTTKPPAKRKLSKNSILQSHSNTPEAQSESESDDEGSEVDAQSASESSGTAASVTSSKRETKRIRAKPATNDVKPKRQSVDRKPSVTVPKAGSSEPLPKARQHVQLRMAEVVKGLFGGSMEDQEAVRYAGELEAALWTSFKEVLNGKDATGSRYKAQFNLLSSSLSRSIRPELRASILDRTLSPAQVAVLSPVDFASAARLQEIEKAKQAVMQQTVKSRGDVEIAAVRLGRDGFEKVEDRHEKEMRVLAQQEEAARTSEKRRESMDVSKVETVEESPKMTREPDERPPVPVTLLHKRSESQDTAMQSPTKHTFAITSAWGDAKREEEAVVSYEGDQEALDLSDIVADPEDEVEFVPEPSEMEVFEAKPAVWSGGIVNPASQSPHVPQISARLASTVPQQTPMYWSNLLPQNPIAITGRVPTDKALRYLSDSRLSPTKELVVVAFSVNPTASEEEKKVWEEMVEYHINRERHGIYLPYGNARLPPNAAKELYLVPLRPSDPSPDFTDLIDGYNLPSTRTSHLFLGVFIISRETAGMSPTRSQSVSVPPPSTLIVPPVPAATIQSDRLKELMASLNPAALQGILAPPAATLSSASTTPVLPSGFQTPAYPAYPPQTRPRPPQPPVQGYHPPFRPPPVPLYAGRDSPMQHQGSWESRRRDGRSRSPDRERSGHGRGRGGGPRESDNGWASRGRGSSGRY